MLLLASGAAAPRAQKAYPVVTVVKDGVKTITNPDYPRDGRFIAKLTEEMSCGEEGATEAATFNKPLEMKVDSNGNIYVWDYGDVHLKVFDSQGPFSNVGRKGQGREDRDDGLHRPAFDGRVSLLDGSQRRSCSSIVRLLPIRVFRRDFPRHRIVGDRIYLAKWEQWESRLPEEFASPVPDAHLSDRRCRRRSTSRRFSRRDLGHESDGRASSQRAACIRSFGGLGLSPIYSFNLDYRLGVWGGREDPGSFGRISRWSESQVRSCGQKPVMPALNPRLIFVFDDEGNVWLDVVQEDAAKDVLYDVFSPEGIYLKQIRLEHRISHIRAGKIYCLIRPADGFPSVKRFRMDLVPDKR
jgi:hypothetical protein